MSSLSAAGQAQKRAKSPDLYISSHAGVFDIALDEQAKPRKEPNGQIFTFQAKLAVLILRHMNSLSAAGQA